MRVGVACGCSEEGSRVTERRENTLRGITVSSSDGLTVVSVPGVVAHIIIQALGMPREVP